MILFGFVHAMLFSGDIIGTYGLAAVVFAGWSPQALEASRGAVRIIDR